MDDSFIYSAFKCQKIIWKKKKLFMFDGCKYWYGIGNRIEHISLNLS